LRRKHCTYVTHDELGVVVLNFYVSGKITKMTSLFKKGQMYACYRRTTMATTVYIIIQVTRRCLVLV